MWDHTTPDGRLTIRETVNGYYLSDTVSGDQRGIGDGVGMYYAYDPQTDASAGVPIMMGMEYPINPGTPRFHERLADDLDRNTDYFLESFFGKGKKGGY